jgi:hypothetical protein
MSKPRPRSFSAIPSAEQTSKNIITASAKGLLTEQQVNKVRYLCLLIQSILHKCTHIHAFIEQNNDRLYKLG